MPKVSVVIPCYNLGSFVEETLASVRAQTFQDLEIILVDDGSTDVATRAVVDRIKAEGGVRVFRTENQGLPATRNFAISQADGEYICCLDADDLLHKQFVAACAAVLDADSEQHLGFVTTHVKVFGEQNSYWYCSDYDPELLLIENVVHVASMFRKQVWQEVGGYAVNLSGFQDWDFWIAVVEAGYRWALVKRPLFRYRDREGSMIKTSEQKRPGLKQQIVANHPNIFSKYHPGLLDRYEKLLLAQKQASRAREVEVAQTALEKLTSLYAAHQKLKQQHQALLEQFQRESGR